MIIYGFGSKNLFTEPANVKCPYCGSEDSLSLKIVANYFHLFWIPFIPTGKIAYLFCSKCKYETEEMGTSDQIKQRSVEIKSELRIPAYLFSGLVIFLLAAVFMVFRSIDRNKLTEEYIRSPMTGDLYEIKTLDDYYSLLKIVNVFDDSVYVCFHSFQTDRKSGLGELKSKKGWQMTPFSFHKSYLINMYKEGYIISVDR